MPGLAVGILDRRTGSRSRGCSYTTGNAYMPKRFVPVVCAHISGLIRNRAVTGDIFYGWSRTTAFYSICIVTTTASEGKYGIFSCYTCYAPLLPTTATIDCIWVGIAGTACREFDPGGHTFGTF